MLNQHRIDMLQGVGANRDQAASEDAPIVYACTSVHPAIDEHDVLRLFIDQNFAPSAQIAIELRYSLA